jgi:replicative DNA helicase
MTVDTFDDLIGEAEEIETRPDSRAIEETLLVGLLDPTVAARILEKTTAKDYEFDRHRELAALLYPMAGEGRHIDEVTFRAALAADKGETFVDNSLSSSDPEDDVRLLYYLARDVMNKAASEPPSKGQVLAYLDIFATQADLRRAKYMVEKAGKALDDRKKTPQAVAGDVLKTLFDLEATQRLAGVAKTEGEELEAFFAALEARQKAGNDFQGLDTGLMHLNRVINGLTSGLFILGAMPSVGKTTLAKQIADNVVERHADAACLFVSLEQSKEELRIKTLSRLSGIENRDMQRGRLDTTAAGWSKVAEAKEAFAVFAGRLQLLEGDRTTTPDRIRLAALQLRQKTQAARLLIVVDYLQIVPTDQEFGDPRQKVDFVVSELRRIARDLDCPVLAIASINRASYGQSGGTLNSYKESGAVEYSADVAFVMVEDKDKEKGEENYLGTMRPWRKVLLDVVKNRNGEKARVELAFFPSVSRFRELSKGSLPEE